MAKVTDAVLPVTVFPYASWTTTTGCVPNAVPPVELPGFVEKASLVAAPALTVTVGDVAKEVAEPEEPFRDAATNVDVPVVFGGVALAYVTVNVFPFFAQLTLTVIVPEEIEPRLAVLHVPFVTVTYPGVPDVVDWGGVHPPGTVRVTMEPAPFRSPALPLSVVKVKASVLPVLPAVTLVGETVIVPEPSVNVVCA